MLKLTAMGMADWLRQRIGLSPLRLPIVGPPGTLAAMTTPDAEPGLHRIAPPGFVNAVCARVVLSIGFYRPGSLADRLPCPVLFQICSRGNS